MATAKKLPSGKYRALVYIGTFNGKRKYKSFTAGTQKEAEYLASEYLMTNKAKNEPLSITLGEAIDVYIESKYNVLSPSTIRGYRIVQRNAFKDIVNVSLSDISSGELLQKHMNKNAKKYSAKSMKNQFGLISAVLNYNNISVPDVTLKPTENKSIPVPTKQEAESIMQALRKHPDIECQVLLALTCSLRQSEIAAIRPSNIDGNVIHIRGARIPDEYNSLVFKSTNKTYAGNRDVVMPEYLCKRIEEVIKTKDKDEFVFNLTPSAVLSRFKKVLKEEGINDYTMHSMRHCFAAIMHANNIPDKYIMEMGGWSSEIVMKKIYQYTFEDETKKAKEAVNNYFDNVIQNEKD